MMKSSTLKEREYLVISASLRADSRSRALAETLQSAYRKLGIDATLLDLREHPLPFCDGEDAYDDPGIAAVGSAIRAARVVVVATPIYNYDANAAVKNLVELTGTAWENKIVGFLCAAGGASSYMSILGFANSLMLDFRCLVIPRFVYVTGDDFDGNGALSDAIQVRVRELAATSSAITVKD